MTRGRERTNETEMESRVYNADIKMSRRKLLGVAGTAAMAGLLLGNGVGLTSQKKDDIEDITKDVDATGSQNGLEETMREYEQRWTGQWEDLKKRLDVLQENHHRNIVNSDGAVTKVLNTALTYVNNQEFKYGTKKTLFSYSGYQQGGRDNNGRYEIDCSSFVQACLSGLTVENSAYKNDGVNFPSRYAPYHFQPSDSFPIVRKLAHTLASQAYEQGWAYEPLADYSNVCACDLIFLFNNPNEGFWKDIGHVMLVSRVDQNKKITVCEAVSNTPPAVKEVIYDAAQLKNKKANLCARFPLRYVSNQLEILNEDPEIVHQQKNSRVITEIHTIKPLKEQKMYTLFLKTNINFAEGEPVVPYPIIKNTKGEIIYSFANTPKRPDRMYRANFFIPKGMLADDHKLIIHSEPKTNSETFLVALFAGYITDYEMD